MTRHHHNENHSSSPFYDLKFAQQRVKGGRLVPTADNLCSSCRMPPPTEWCWSHNPTCPLRMPLRGAEAITVRCEFGILGVPPQPGTMTFRPGSSFATFVADNGSRCQVRLDVLRASFEYEAPS